MAKTQSSIRKHLLLTLTNNIFVLCCSECLHHPSSFYKVGITCICDLWSKYILSEIKWNQNVAGRLTVDPLTQRSICGFLFSLVRNITLVNMFRLRVTMALPLAKLTSFCRQVILLWYTKCINKTNHHVVPILICFTTRQTILRNN